MKRILVVDDDEDLLVTLKTFLRKNSYEVATTTSCKKGLEILRDFNPDLILLDINVGDEDGRLMCRQIKEQADYEHIRVILVSANDEALKSYRDCRADSFLGKPYEFSVMQDVLKSHL